MSSSYQGQQQGNGLAEQSRTMFLALGACNPFWAAALTGNPQAHEGIGAIASEWQGFVTHRLQQDMALMQRLTRSLSPDHILAAYTDFWHQAAEDYGKEITTMTRLATGVMSKNGGAFTNRN
ncbi:MAG TPA: phasin family protein [Hyphomicrobiaceae bacterium]|nr:phasin family protein [Hyphomicrobiaceae bacterium]